MICSNFIRRLRGLRPVLALALLCLAQATFGQSFASAPPRNLGFSEERLARLDAALAGYVENEQLAGSVTLVLRDGSVVYEKAFGLRDVDTEAPMHADTIFRIASQTKAIASTVAMILQEEGRLLISDPVSRFLPEFADTKVAVANDEGGYDLVPARREITIRDLLTHTSGYDYGDGIAGDLWQQAGIEGYYFSDRNEPIREIVRQMAALPASAHPGEQWVYGYSTDILGAVLEVASGEPLDELLTSRVLEPLRMNDTHFYLPAEKRERLATLYGMFDGQLRRAPEEGMGGQGAFDRGPRKSFSAGAGLLSTARDYGRFLQMILNGGELDGVRIMSRKSVELMSVSHLGDVPFRAGMGFGLGFSVVEDLGERGTLGSVGELAWGGAYHSTYWIDPSERLIVVHLAQLRPAGDVNDQQIVRSLIYSAFTD